jgi:MFS family permease
MTTAEIEEQGGEARERKGGAPIRALAHRNFRLFWAGGFLSNVGTWMQALAQGWLMLQLTNSAFWLGFDGFCATAPAIILTPLGGVFADTLDRKRLLIISQIVAGAGALVLSVLIWTHVIHFTMILAASLVTGCCFALASPAYQALIIELVGRKDLSNAIALNSAQFQLSRVLGPVFAGLAFRFFGVAGCFFVNGISYIAIVVALMLVRIPKRGAAGVTTASATDATTNATDASLPSSREDAPIAAVRPAIDRRAVWRDLKEGFRYVLHRPRVFTLLMISSVTSLCGAPYITMMPIFARDVFHLDASGLSILMGTAGAGAFCGAVMLALMGDVRRKGWFVLGGTFMFGVCVVGFALSRTLTPALVFLFLVGFGIVSCIAVINMLLQHLVTDEMRGRVMSMFMLSFFGAFPVGNFVAGVAADRYGAPYTLAVGGALIAVFVTVVALLNPRLRALN